MKYDVFISYSRKDTAVADEIAHALDSAGISYFIDRRNIAGGMDFPLVLANAIMDSRLVLFLASTNSYSSKFTLNEITFALNKKDRNSILPYIIDDSTLPIELEFIVASINWRKKSEHPVSLLVSDLLTLLDRTDPSGESKVEEWLTRGQEAYDTEKYGEAVEWYRKAAEYGNAEGQCNLGSMYDEGEGVEQDKEEAVRWYGKAAAQGDRVAQYNLGFMYENGEGVVQSYEEAMRWYNMAASQGDADAQFRIACMYSSGDGVKRDMKEALRWYHMAADQGNAEAQRALGDMYNRSKNVVRDLHEAVRWYCEAAGQGDESALDELERLCWEGLLNEADIKKIVYVTEMLAERGLPLAQRCLGDRYCSGNGVEQDYSEAMRWYRMAAGQGDDRAQLSIGCMYARGLGVEVDKDEARKWMLMAHENGNPDAEEEMECL